MKRMSLLVLAAAVACQRPRAPERYLFTDVPRPPMDSALAEQLCTNPAAVKVFRVGCELRDQSPPRRFLPSRPTLQ